MDDMTRPGRRLRHVSIMDVPSFPRPPLITDAAINLAPALVRGDDV